MNGKLIIGPLAIHDFQNEFAFEQSTINGKISLKSAFPVNSANL